MSGVAEQAKVGSLVCQFTPSKMLTPGILSKLVLSTQATLRELAKNNGLRARVEIADIQMIDGKWHIAYRIHETPLTHKATP